MKFIRLLLQALKGDESLDYTKIPINRALFLLSVPMVIEMIFESLFALVDAFFVAKYVGINGMATVGLTESVLTIIYSLAWGISTAATAIIARKIGENNPIDASKSLMQIINISAFLGILLSVFGYRFSEDILRLMGGSKELIAEGLPYTQIQFISSPIIILLFSLGGALRGAGSGRAEAQGAATLGQDRCEDEHERRHAQGQHRGLPCRLCAGGDQTPAADRHQL